MSKDKTEKYYHERRRHPWKLKPIIKKSSICKKEGEMCLLILEESLDHRTLTDDTVGGWESAGYIGNKSESSSK